MPLISLVFDQVTYLKNVGVKAENVCGQNRIIRYQDIVEKGIKLIYTTPGIDYRGNVREIGEESRNASGAQVAS